MILSRGLGLVELQEAVYLRLKQALPDVTIYDAVPDDEVFPYVVLGDETATDWSGKADAGLDVAQLIQVFSRADGFREAKEIGERVAGALTAGTLLVDGQRVLDVALDGTETFRDQEDRRLVLRFRIRLQERQE